VTTASGETPLSPQAPAAKPARGWSRRAIPLVFLVLSIPTFGQLLGGDLTIDAAAVRCLVALVVAMVGMQLLEGLVGSYTREPEPEPEPEPAVIEAADPDLPEPVPARRAEDAPEPA
jgi:hypothetical protein